MRAALFKKADRPGYSQLKVAAADIKPAIFGHAEFTAFNDSVTKLFAKWKTANTPHLKGIDKGGKPKALIETLSEDLLDTFQKAPTARRLRRVPAPHGLLGRDDAGRRLHDRGRRLARSGQAPATRRGQKGSKAKEKPDFTVGKLKYKTELIPPALVIARYFAAEQAAIEKLEAETAVIEQSMEEMAEEHGGEDGLLAEAKNDKGKLTKASVAARLKEIKGDAEAADERKVLERLSRPHRKELATRAKVKAAARKPSCQGRGKYGQADRGRDQDAGGG